jgi:hypothetical protein
MVQVKKALMTYIWRIQQSQMIISIVFWSLTLTGIFYQYFAPLFDIYLGVPQENVFLGMLLLLFIVLAGVISGSGRSRPSSTWKGIRTRGFS